MQWRYASIGACGAFIGDKGGRNSALGPVGGAGNLLRICAPGIVCVRHVGRILGGVVTVAGETTLPIENTRVGSQFLRGR